MNKVFKMAIQLNTTYTGRVEDLIYYERLGDFLIRTVQKQTMRTKRAARQFGRASSLAKDLRTLLATIIPDTRDKQMQNRLTVAMRHFLAEADKSAVIDPQNNHLAGFQFAADSALSRCLLFNFDVFESQDGEISLGIPAINPVEAIAAPPGTSKAEIRFMAARLHPDNNMSYSGQAVIEVPYNDGMIASQNIELETGSEPGSIMIVAASLRYWQGSEEIRQPGFMPAEIAAVIKL
jgi:hypothetical protein